MKVKLQMFGTISKLAAPSLEVGLKKGASVADLIDSLVEQYGAEFAARINCRELWQISINGHLQSLTASMEIMLRDRDEVAILALQFGG